MMTIEEVFDVEWASKSWCVSDGGEKILIFGVTAINLITQDYYVYIKPLGLSSRHLRKLYDLLETSCRGVNLICVVETEKSARFCRFFGFDEVEKNHWKREI